MKQILTFAFLVALALGITLVALVGGMFNVIRALVAAARTESNAV